LGLTPSNIDYELISHLDCDHANGLRQVKDARHILVSEAEMIGTTRKNFQIMIRYQKRWWEGVDLRTFDWNGMEGPVGKSYDVLGDGSLVMVNIPGHSEGLCALKIRNAEGKYVLLFADGGYATKSWRDMITSGITLDKQMQRKSLQWIREQSLSPDCIESVATHDSGVQPHVIEL
jgi:glyoxylase-like metal-dependent hydrolase (beta-lactamase superfamily II)